MKYISRYDTGQGLNIYKIADGVEYIMAHMRWTDGLNSEVEKAVEDDAVRIVDSLNRITALERENAELKKTINELSGKLNRSPDWDTFEQLRDELSALREAAANYIKATDNLKHYRSLWAFEEITHDKLALAEQGQKVAESTLRALLDNNSEG